MLLHLQSPLYRAASATLRAALPCLLALGFTSAAHAQAYPARPVKLIVPFAVGGSGDLIGRLLAERLGPTLGQTVLVDNKGGNGSILGTDLAAKAAPDGYTLVLTNGAAITTGPLIGQNVPYRPLDDFRHVMLIGTFTNALIVRGEHPAKTFPAFINLARANPGRISYGSAGVGSAGFLTGELLKQLAKIDMVHIPYKGTGPALTDMLGGQIDAMFNALIAAAPHIRGGKVRALAITAEHRDPDFPEVPTMAESVPGAVGDAWFGIAVPAKTPPAVAEQLRVALARSMEAPEFRQKLNALGLAPLPLGPKELLTFIDAENRKWAPVIRAANIKPE